MSEPGTSLDPKRRLDSSPEPGEELERRREEILRLRDLLIGKDAELRAAKAHVAELEEELRRYTRIADHLRHPWRLFHVVLKRLRARRNPRD